MRNCTQCNSFNAGADGYAKLYGEVKAKFLAEVARTSTRDAKQQSPGKDYYKEMDTRQKEVDALIAKFGTRQCPHRNGAGQCPNQAEATTIRGGMICGV